MRGRDTVRRRYPRIASGLDVGGAGILGRPLRLIALSYVALGFASALLFRSTIAAQADALVVLSAVLETPALTWVIERATDEPRAEEAVVAGVPATVVRPSGSGPWPAVVFVNGVTPRGRHHPEVQAFAHGLARAGRLVVVPDLPGLAAGEVTVRTLAATAQVAEETAAGEEAREGEVALVGVSVGASLALVAAAEPGLASRVSVIAGVAPYANIEQVSRLATLEAYESDGRLLRYKTPGFLLLVAARSLIAALPAGDERERLLAALPATHEVGEDVPDPLAELRRVEPPRTPEARAVLALLLNRDPARFATLYARLPSAIREANAELSPVNAADRLLAPVELASAPRDKYFPPAESREVARVAPDARVTVTTTLEHAVPEASLAALADLVRFDAFAVRFLRRAD